MPTYEPVVPEGQHLGASHEVDGAVTGHLFDDVTNKLQGHAAWREVDEPDFDYSSHDDGGSQPELTQEEIEQAAAVAALIILGIIKVAVVASPHIKRWWIERVIPTAKSLWTRLPRKVTVSTEVASSPTTSESRSTFVVSSTGVEIAIAESKATMSAAEWEQRFRAMLAAGAFQENQRRILVNARIEDVRKEFNSPDSNKQLTPQEFADRIALMIKANLSLLNNSTLSELERVFGSQPKPSDRRGKHQREL